MRPGSRAIDRTMLAAVCLVLAAGPLEFAVDFDAVFRIAGAPVLTLSKVAGAIFFLTYGVWFVAGRHRLRFDASQPIVGSLLLLAFISSAFAAVRVDAVAGSIRYVSFAALFLALTHVFIDHRARLAGAWALIVSSAIVSTVAIREFMLQRASAAHARYGSVNDLPFVLIAVIPLAIWLQGRAGRARPLIVACAAIMIASVVLSYSRSTILGLTAALIWYVIRGRVRVHTLLRWTAAAVVMLAALVALDSAHLSATLQGKAGVARASVDNRLALWRAAGALVVEHPVLGVGPGNFRDYYRAHWNDPGIEHLTVVHDTYLEIAVEAGLPAAALFVAFLVLTFRRLSSLGPDPADGPLADALAAAWLACAIAGLFLSSEFSPPFWVLGAFGGGLWLDHRRCR